MHHQTITLLSLLLPPGNLYSLSLKICYSRNLMYVESYDICPYVWIILLRIMFSSVILCCSMCQNFSPFNGGIILHRTYIYRILFIYSSVEGYLGYFHLLTIVNNAAMNISVRGIQPLLFFGGGKGVYT
uniref:Uncharacterized protein n=1 Tax=Rousettus aegyptiacus TaxID=9407 RepID=A0A7J8H1L0_ROUAE|nr:hypothetical protein HJG63_011220 [Rousettus aegyptiacus]